MDISWIRARMKWIAIYICKLSAHVAEIDWCRNTIFAWRWQLYFITRNCQTARIDFKPPLFSYSVLYANESSSYQNGLFLIQITSFFKWIEMKFFFWLKPVLFKNYRKNKQIMAQKKTVISFSTNNACCRQICPCL